MHQGRIQKIGKEGAQIFFAMTKFLCGICMSFHILHSSGGTVVVAQNTDGTALVAQQWWHSSGGTALVAQQWWHSSGGTADYHTSAVSSGGTAVVADFCRFYRYKSIIFYS